MLHVQLYRLDSTGHRILLKVFEMTKMFEKATVIETSAINYIRVKYERKLKRRKIK